MTTIERIICWLFTMDPILLPGINRNDAELIGNHSRLSDSSSCPLKTLSYKMLNKV